jgi:hypothetical protein
MSMFCLWLLLPHLQWRLIHGIVCKHPGMLDLQCPVSKVTQEAHQPAHSTHVLHTAAEKQEGPQAMLQERRFLSIHCREKHRAQGTQTATTKTHDRTSVGRLTYFGPEGLR